MYHSTVHGLVPPVLESKPYNFSNEFIRLIYSASYKKFEGKLFIIHWNEQPRDVTASHISFSYYSRRLVGHGSRTTSFRWSSQSNSKHGPCPIIGIKSFNDWENASIFWGLDSFSIRGSRTRSVQFQGWRCEVVVDMLGLSGLGGVVGWHWEGRNAPGSVGVCDEACRLNSSNYESIIGSLCGWLTILPPKKALETRVQGAPVGVTLRYLL